MRPRRIIFATIGFVLVGAVFIPGPIFRLDVIETNILLIEQDSTFEEDIYVVANIGRIEGRVEGDVVIATGELTIDGTITGDLFVLSHSTLRINGTVEGSVRGLVRSIEVSGTTGDDLAVVAVRADVSGSVGRDVLMLVGSGDLAGAVGRDVKGRMFDLDVNGTVGRDIDVTVRSLAVGASTDVGGDFLYRADDEAEIPAEAKVGGVTARLSSRASFLVRLYLTVATALAFVLFVVLGFMVLWLFPETSASAATSVLKQPVRTLLIGVIAGVVTPFTAVFLVVRAGSAIGAVILSTLIGLLVAVVLTLGPVPPLAIAGNRLTRDRAGLFGGFLVAAIIWRSAAALVPLLGAIIGIAAYIWGVGAWLAAIYDRRSRRTGISQLWPELARRRREPVVPDGWEPPLPP